MLKMRLALSLLVLISPSAICAGQAKSNEARSEAPATAKDVRQLGKTLRGELSRATAKLSASQAEASAKAEEAVKDATRKAISEAKLSIQNELESRQTAEREQAKRQAELTRVRYRNAILLAVLLAILISGGAYGLFTWKRVKYGLILDEGGSFSSVEEYIQSVPRLNKDFQTTGLASIPATIVVPNNGTEFDGARVACVIIAGKTAKETSVLFHGYNDDRPVPWTHRTKHAVKVVRGEKSDDHASIS